MSNFRFHVTFVLAFSGAPALAFQPTHWGECSNSEVQAGCETVVMQRGNPNADRWLSACACEQTLEREASTPGFIGRKPPSVQCGPGLCYYGKLGGGCGPC